MNIFTELGLTVFLALMATLVAYREQLITV